MNLNNLQYHFDIVSPHQWNFAKEGGGVKNMCDKQRQGNVYACLLGHKHTILYFCLNQAAGVQYPHTLLNSLGTIVGNAKIFVLHHQGTRDAQTGGVGKFSSNS